VLFVYNQLDWRERRIQWCAFCVLQPTDLNLLDWSSRNVLAVALQENVYLWDATRGDITLLMKMEREEDYISSVSWTKDGNYLAIGTSDCKVQVSVLITHTDSWLTGTPV